MGFHLPCLFVGLLVCLFVCLFVCASTLNTCTIISSCTLLPCNLTLVDFTVALSTGVATLRSLAQLQVKDIEEQRQHRCEAD